MVYHLDRGIFNILLQLVGKLADGRSGWLTRFGGRAASCRGRRTSATAALGSCRFYTHLVTGLSFIVFFLMRGRESKLRRSTPSPVSVDLFDGCQELRKKTVEVEAEAKLQKSSKMFKAEEKH